VTNSLLDGHDAVLLDLDGTVYRGGELVAGAGEAIERVHRQGVAVRYVTNNASKTPRQVVDHLMTLGLSAQVQEISTSAQAGAALLAERLPAGARVLVVGSEALVSEVDNVGLAPVRLYEDQPVAVIQGHSPDTGWKNLAEACLALRHGALWVASNTDLTLPTERGEVPGNGSMVAALEFATGRKPIVAGKPERPLLERAVTSAGAKTPLMIGDRLETDIAGAVNAGMPCLLVLTGISGPRDALGASAEYRPTHIGPDLRALHGPAAEFVVAEHPAWKVETDGSSLRLSAGADDTDDPLAALRALCAAWWPAGSGVVPVAAQDARAERVLRALDLS
jgi:HAD superfamily hydrolase (TIGR01450 family)